MARSIALAIALSLAASLAIADGPSGELVSLARSKSPAGTPKETADLAALAAANWVHLRESGQEAVKAARNRQERTERQRSLAAHEKAKADWLKFPSLPNPPKVGAIGTMWHPDGVNIRQIVGPDKMLAACYLPSGEPEPILHFLKVPTAGLVDGAGYDAPGLYKIVGTETYKTALGASNTVFVLEPVEFDEAAVKAACAEILKAMPRR